MTTGPQLKLGPHLVPGLAAVALFGVVAAVTFAAEFPDPMGFPEGANVTASIGYAMFNIATDRISGQTLVGAESFLVAFMIVAILLDAALDGAVMLAKREDGSFGELVADGGRRLSDRLAGDDSPGGSSPRPRSDAGDDLEGGDA
jgi:NADH-quinone oxidoreductase subunit J